MKKKLMYEVPDAELIVFNCQKALMASDFKTEQLTEGNSSWWNDEEE